MVTSRHATISTTTKKTTMKVRSLGTQNVANSNVERTAIVTAPSKAINNNQQLAKNKIIKDEYSKFVIDKTSQLLQ